MKRLRPVDVNSDTPSAAPRETYSATRQKVLFADTAAPLVLAPARQTLSTAAGHESILDLELPSDKPVALIAVRLNETRPGGTSRKMTYGQCLDAIGTAIPRVLS